MTLEECWEGAGRKFPFKVTRKAWRDAAFWISVECRLSNDEFVGVSQYTRTLQLNFGDRDWILIEYWKPIEPEKPRVFRWEFLAKNIPPNFDGPIRVWVEDPAFLTITGAQSFFSVQSVEDFRKSRLHGTVYPAEGWEDS